MSDIQQNTLYVVTQGADLHRDHLTVQVQVERTNPPGRADPSPGVGGRLRQHHGQSGGHAALRGAWRRASRSCRSRAGCSAGSMRRARATCCCGERSSVGPISPNRRPASPGRWWPVKSTTAAISCSCAARETDQATDQAPLQSAAGHLGEVIRALPGAAATGRSAVTRAMRLASISGASPPCSGTIATPSASTDRTRRPPAGSDQCSAVLPVQLAAAGLRSRRGRGGARSQCRLPARGSTGASGFGPGPDGGVSALGGRPSGVALINRQQVKPGGFHAQEGGAVQMDDATRRTVLAAYQQRKREEVTHPVAGTKGAGRPAALFASPGAGPPPAWRLAELCPVCAEGLSDAGLHCGSWARGGRCLCGCW